MRIAYLSSSTLPSRAANSIHVMKMCQALAALGHEVFLVARSGTAIDDEFAHYGVDATFSIVKCRVPKPPVGAEAIYAVATAAKLQSIRPDLIYARHLLSLCANSWRGVPMVLEAHASPSRLDQALQSYLLRRSSFARLVVISDALRQEMQRLHPELAATTIRLAHDAADAPASEQPEDLLGERRGELRAGYVGHLYPGKGAEILVELAKRLPWLEIHAVGGTDGDIRRWREQTAGQDNLIFHGFVEPRLTDAYRAGMDVLLAPYQEQVAVHGGSGDVARWMSPLKLFEYMAAGRAIVCSDLPVLREVLTDGEEALLVPPADLDAWQQALERLRDPSLRDALGRRAASAFESRHTWAGRAHHVLEGLEL